MESKIFALTIGFIFLITFPLSSEAACTAKDTSALVAFKNHFPPNIFADSWETDDNCCFWDGVGCDYRTGRVTSLYFSTGQYNPYNRAVDLNGTIPPSIADLTALETISFSSFSNLVGTLPVQMASLKNLKYFTVYNCSISGPIPSFVSEWTHLMELQISSCGKLTGSIPSSLGDLVNLTSIIFDYNKLSGTIPSSLFSRLSEGSEAQLFLDNNELTGPIPRSFASIKWNNIDLSNNQLCGRIPSGGNYTSISGAPFAHNKCLCGSPLPACK